MPPSMAPIWGGEPGGNRQERVKGEGKGGELTSRASGGATPPGEAATCLR